MKNLPKKIYLNIGTNQSEDFKELSEVTWGQDRISNDCIEYVLASASTPTLSVDEASISPIEDLIWFMSDGIGGLDESLRLSEVWNKVHDLKAGYQVRQQPVKNPMLEKLRSEICTSDKQEIDEYIKSVDGEQPVRKTLDECMKEASTQLGVDNYPECFIGQTKAVEPQQEWIRSPDTLYTYYKVEYKNCSMDYDETICQDLDAVRDAILVVDGQLDDDSDFEPECKPSVTITGIGMTDRDYEAWLKSVEDDD